MVSKCANPSCSNQLVYLREGKIFVMEHSTKPRLWPNGPIPAKAAARLEHFWLCGHCARNLTLVYDRERGVEVVAKVSKRPARRERAAAS
jgi:hypothetical protein